ncbi:ATP-dependent DNA helicase RRM3-like [Cannabis sativa]|uniref:ATP-dependent DNA helicase RRM3-like n=1 Tax=Cannabis sativa TaxID=3483 RepID=UPI0029CA397D|nr:ATP-dependent DNA helicase RRM3-like [Cannabis sativa]
MGKDINDYNLVDNYITDNEIDKQYKEINEQLAIVVSKEDILAANLLNLKQKNAFDLILNTIFNNQTGLFFIDGPGGTGKTFLYKTILAAVRSKKIIALAVASSGIAASILPGGRTAHSLFKIPLHLDNYSSCSVSKQSGLSKLLQLTKLIIWDEAPMSNKEAIEALNYMLKDINNSTLPFGGKVIVFGGDFRQVLPVVPKGTREQMINASLVKSELWPLFTKITLTDNMRAKQDPLFSNYLLNIGNGTEPTIDGKIQLLSSMILPYEDDDTSLNNLIDFVFPDINNYTENMNTILNRVILTPKNEYVDHINKILINRFPGNSIKYYSFDETVDKNEQGVQEDFMNSLTPSGFPAHELTLKLNCPIILLRNINTSEGLCNGTRLICRQFGSNIIDAEIVTGDHCGKRIFLPRIPFTPLENEKNIFPFKRTQFPIRLSFAMTINKVQGQTLDSVGVFLPEPVFSHGQLYVALSRAKTLSALRVLIRPPSGNEADNNHTLNIVYEEILLLSNTI